MKTDTVVSDRIKLDLGFSAYYVSMRSEPTPAFRRPESTRPILQHDLFFQMCNIFAVRPYLRPSASLTLKRMSNIIN